MIEPYLPDGTPIAGDLPIPSYEAGQDSESVILHLWNSKGDPSAQTLEPVLLVMRTEDSTRPGVYLATGVPPQDELWGRARIIGFENPGDPSYSVTMTDWTVLGAFSGLRVISLPADCAVHVELRLHPPTSAQGGTSWRHRLVGIHGEHSLPVPPALTAFERGILHGVGDPRYSAIVDGLVVTSSDPADDLIHVSPGRWIHRGRPLGQISTTHQLDQVDGAGALLADGESYWAVLTMGAVGGNVTKGEKGADPAQPTPPAGELVIKSIRVDHQPEGSSVIEPEDLDGETIYDRYLFIPDEQSLGGRLHAGQAIASGTWRLRTRPLPIALPPDVTSYVWQLASGNFTLTAGEEPPEDTAPGPLWEIETDAVAVVRVVDRRIFAGRSRVITLKGAPPAAVPGEVDSVGIEDDRLFIERVSMRVLGNGGSSGQTVGDVLVNGASIFVSQGIDDQRPRVAFDAGDVRVAAGVAERFELRRGDVVSFVVAEMPSGGGPGVVGAQLFCHI